MQTGMSDSMNKTKMMARKLNNKQDNTGTN